MKFGLILNRLAAPNLRWRLQIPNVRLRDDGIFIRKRHLSGATTASEEASERARNSSSRRGESTLGRSRAADSASGKVQHCPTRWDSRPPRLLSIRYCRNNTFRQRINPFLCLEQYKKTESRRLWGATNFIFIRLNCIFSYPGFSHPYSSHDMKILLRSTILRFSFFFSHLGISTFIYSQLFEFIAKFPYKIAKPNLSVK